MDLEQFIADPTLIAARFAASDLFSMRRRSVKWPFESAALVRGEDGSISLLQPGDTLESRNVRDVTAIKTAPHLLEYRPESVESSDHYACDTLVRFAVRLVVDRSDMESFCDRILGSNRRAETRALNTHLYETIVQITHDFAAGRSADALVRSTEDDAFRDALTSALRKPLFAAGLQLHGDIALVVRSDDWSRSRQEQRDHDARKRRMEARVELASQSQALRESHVSQMSALLGRLDELAATRPGVSVADLVRSFSAAERADLYRQLLSRGLSAESTESIATVAGTLLLFHDPNSGSERHRHNFADQPLGALRSIRSAARHHADTLLIGAHQGVYLYDRRNNAVTAYPISTSARLRGGVNAAVMLDDHIYATHSEIGVIRWRRDDPGSFSVILAEHTHGAASVRDILADEDGTLWFAAGERVIGWSPRDNQPAQDVTVATASSGGTTDTASTGAATGTLVSMGSIAGSGNAPRVSALTVADGFVYAGTSDGNLWHWPCREPHAAFKLLSGERGRIESIQKLVAGGIERLLIASQRPYVTLLVLNDVCQSQFACDEPLRFAAAADDWVFAVNDRRDRVHLWRPTQPERFDKTILISREVGHSIQDAALLPAASPNP